MLLIEFSEQFTAQNVFHLMFIHFLLLFGVAVTSLGVSTKLLYVGPA